MSKSEIRVQYSGFIIFAAQIFSTVTGLAFTLLLTRISARSPSEFGAWSFIFYLTALFTIVSGVFPFWATRWAARGKEGAIKTATTANALAGLVSALAYLAFVSPMLGTFHVDPAFMLIYALAALYILNGFLIVVFEGCLRAVKPQTIGYGLLVEEIVKVSLAYTLIVGLNLLFLGAMISLIAAAAAQAIFYIWLLRDEFHHAIRWNYLREWLRGGSAAFIYNAVGLQLTNLTLYLLLLYGGQAGLGYYQAAVTFSTVISYASALAFALYPKMLAQKCPADVSTSLKTMIMLALPMAVVTLSMAPSLLTVLNASFAPASPILMLLTLDALVVLVSQFYTQCLMGAETFDVEGKIRLREFARSKMFKVFTLPYLQAAVMLPTVYVALLVIGSANPVLAAVTMVSVNIVVHAGSFVALYSLLRGEMRLPVAWKNMAKYGLASIVAAAVLLVLPSTTTLLATVGKALVGLAAYALILYAIDIDARKIVRQVFDELRSIL